MRDVQKAASDLQKKWLKNYIWQRQGFGLELAREDGEVCHAPRAVQPPNRLTFALVQVLACFEEEQNMAIQLRMNG